MHPLLHLAERALRTPRLLASMPRGDPRFCQSEHFASHARLAPWRPDSPVQSGSVGPCLLLNVCFPSLGFPCRLVLSINAPFVPDLSRVSRIRGVMLRRHLILLLSSTRRAG